MKLASCALECGKSLRITVRPNGEVTQDDAADHLVKSFSGPIADASTFMTLKPGDIIVTGLPAKLEPSVARWS